MVESLIVGEDFNGHRSEFFVVSIVLNNHKNNPFLGKEFLNSYINTYDTCKSSLPSSNTACCLVQTSNTNLNYMLSQNGYLKKLQKYCLYNSTCALYKVQFFSHKNDK